MTGPHRSGSDALTLVGAELFLALTTLSAVAGFSRVFSDTIWLSPMIAATLVAHITVTAMRRLGRGLMLSGAVSAVVMILQITWTHYRSTLTAGLPTGATRAAISDDLRGAWNLFSEVKAPTESVVGFVVIATLAVWVVVYLSDWAAFRLWSALETILPTFAVFVFIAFFGEEADRLSLAALYLAAVVGFQLFHRLIRQSHEVRWLAGTQNQGTSALVRTGAVLSLIIVMGAVVVGPALPGAEQEALLDVGARSGGPDTRVVISPIVDIRGRLVEQAKVEAFTVRTETPSYWRLASLDSFNGQIWGADNKYGKIGDTLPDDFPVDATTQVVTQEFVISNLDAVWVPAAYEARAMPERSNSNISYEPISGTLIVGRGLRSSDGLSYTVVSEVPIFDPNALAAAPNAYPQDILDRYTELPDDFSPNAIAQAFEITAGEDTVYGKALSLQNFFREFTYDLEVGPGHSSNRIDSFLAARVGYCEQFAGSFAAMIRALGIPSRVAVGFTWGEVDPNDPTLYHVRGEHAHAWPEVYIPNSGWVAFEPTPTRGAPNGSAWTNVTPAQAGNEDGGAALPTPIPSDIVPDLSDQFDTPDLPEDPLELGAGATDSRNGVPGWLIATAGLIVLAGVLVILYGLAIVGLKRSIVRRRFANATDNRQRVNAVWNETVESLSPMQLTQEPTETLTEFATRAGDHNIAARGDLSRLGELTVNATYGPDEPATTAVEAAEQHRDNVIDAVEAATTTTDRLKDSLDPRTLLRR